MTVCLAQDGAGSVERVRAAMEIGRQYGEGVCFGENERGYLQFDDLTALLTALSEAQRVIGLMRRSFGDPITRRSLGGHNESQMEAMFAARAWLAANPITNEKEA